MSKSRIFVFNSVQKLSSSTSNYDAIFQIQDNVPDLGFINGVEFLSFTMPNTIYNIRTGVNDRVVFRRSATDYSYVIPPGMYDIVTLATLIGPGMIVADANNYAATYSSTTGKLTITGTGAFVLNWSTNANAATGAWKELGFTQADTSSATSQTGTNVVSLERPLSVYVDMVEVPTRLTNIPTTSTVNRYHFVVNMNQASGNVVFATAQSQYEQKIDFGAKVYFPKQFTIRLKLADGSTVNANGADWELQVLFKGE